MDKNQSVFSPQAPTEKRNITDSTEPASVLENQPHSLLLVAIVMLLCTIAILLLEYFFAPQGLMGWI
ncbi:MAG: hypothetical protein ABW153_09835 [Sedimenticola sp.]